MFVSSFLFYNYQKLSSNFLVCFQTWLIEENGKEAHQSSLLYAFLGYFEVWPGYVCSFNWSIEALRLRNSCIVIEHRTTDVQGQGTSDVNVILFVCFFDVYISVFRSISLY